MSNFLDFDVVEHYTCAHFLGAYNFNWMIQYFHEDNIGEITLEKVWDASVSGLCLDITYNFHKIYALINVDDDEMYYVKTHITGGSDFDVIKFRMQNTDPMITKSAFFIENDKFFYVGNFAEINTLAYSENVGFIQKYPQSDCVTYSPVTITLSKQTLSAFTSVSTPVCDVSTVSSVITVAETLSLVSDASVLSKPLIDIGIRELPNDCIATPSLTGTISPPSFSNPIVFVMDSSPLMVVNFDDFSYSEPCDDLQWTYIESVTTFPFTMPSNIVFTVPALGSTTGFSLSILNPTTIDQRVSLTIQITATLGALSSLTLININFAQTLTVNHAPIFNSDFEQVLIIEAKSSKKLSLPLIHDKDGDSVTLTLTNLFGNQPPTFISMSGSTIALNPTSKDVGIYICKIKLTDANPAGPMSNDYRLMITVTRIVLIKPIINDKN